MRPSILERLIDRTRDRNRTGPGAGSPAAIAEEIRADVEALLNTRCAFSREWADEHPGLQESIVCYGMPDEGHVNLTSQKDVDDLRKRIEKVVATFEPRIHQVRVKVLERPKDLSRDVVLEINATIRLEDYQERVTWNSTLHGGSIELRGDG